MFISVNDKTWAVKFSRQGTTTLADLFRVTDEGLVATGIQGVAKVYYTDRFEKSQGRKEALANLLDKVSIHYQEVLDDDGYLVDIVPVYPDTPLVLNKEMRTQIWDQYFQSHRK